MKLLGNKALVHLPPNKSASGIILPPSAQDEKLVWKRGVVVALGVGIKPECSVKVGDVVLFQFGFDTVDKDALGGLSQDDAEHPFAVDGELWVGSPEGLFAVVEKVWVKRNRRRSRSRAIKK